VLPYRLGFTAAAAVGLTASTVGAGVAEVHPAISTPDVATNATCKKSRREIFCLIISFSPKMDSRKTGDKNLIFSKSTSRIFQSLHLLRATQAFLKLFACAIEKLQQNTD
jgi:hypothetical protein